MEHLYERVLHFVPVGAGRVLDAGCGIGVLLRLIRMRFPSVDLHGVDFSRVAVRRTRAYGFVAQVAVLPTVPYPDEYFDCVVCTEVLEHMDSPGRTVAEFRRVLRRKGKLIVSVPREMGPEDCIEHVQDFTEESLREVIIEGGFDIEALEVVVREPERGPASSFLAVGEKVAP